MPTAPLPRHSIWLGAAVRSGLYVCIYLILDHVSYIDDLNHTEITLWAPGIAFLMAVVFYHGAWAAPLTIIFPGIAEFALRNAAPLSPQVLGAVFSMGCTYTLAGLLLRALLSKYRQSTVRWFATLSAVIAGSALLDATVYSAILAWNGSLPSGSYLNAVRTDWVGDANGIIILLPLVMILEFRESGRLRLAGAHIGLLALQSAALAFVFLLTFPESWGAPIDDSRTPFYLLFLPIIWIALRWGAAITAIALVLLQLGIVLFVAPQNTAESFLAIQFLMILLAFTGLFMGISVNEAARVSQLMRTKDIELSNLNARMAVSELNSAIGHELNNPLAALVNYLRSASLMLESPRFEQEALQRTLDKAHGEATRSINVLRKLREFFRSGIVRAEKLDPKKLAAEVLAGMQSKFQLAGIDAVMETSPDIPAIQADSLQLVMVLQNLMANAYDATRAGGPGAKRVSISIARSGDDVMFMVMDTGMGIPEAMRDQLFRPVNSTKAVGMGLGLAICRSLVEANDGRISLLRSGAEGTSIAFWIPVAVGEVDEVEG